MLGILLYWAVKMKFIHFQINDEVALSAKFLRSLGTESFGVSGGSGPSRYDKGIGVIMGFLETIPDIAIVQWADLSTSNINVFNLVKRKDIHIEAMHAENDIRVGKTI